MPLGVNAVVLITHESTYASQRYLLTHTYRIVATNSTQTPAVDTADIALFFTQTGATDYVTKYRACLGNNVVINRVTAQGIWPLRFVRRSVDVNMPGLMASSALTGNVAGVVTLRTSLAGRSQVSNKHLGPPATSTMNEGAPDATLFPALAVMGIAFVADRLVNLSTAGQTISLRPVIFHRVSGTNSDVEDAEVSDRIGTMRRRTLRVGQ